MSARFESPEVRRALGLPPAAGRTRYASVTTDTRSLRRGALFVALQGQRFDGVDFLAEARRRGALGAVVPAGRTLPDLDLEWFVVPDTLRALGDLARAWRRRCAARVVGITGSSGKTTVKEMLALALRARLRAHATPGNLNNLVGVPLSMLAAPADADVWVLELGTSQPGEVARLASVCEPDDAIVTTVGPAHLEGLGDVEGVLREKLSLVRAAKGAGAVVVGERPAELVRAARAIRPDTVVAGLEPGAAWRPERWGSEAGSAWMERDGVRWHLHVGGEHHVRDAALASAMAEAHGVPAAEAARALAAYEPIGLRGLLLRAGRLSVLADCYNANPESFAAAIRYAVDAFPGRRRAAVVSSMLELGDRSNEAHAEVARLLHDADFDPVIALGAFRSAFDVLGAGGRSRVRFATGVSDALRLLEESLHGDELVLVKASRGERLERVVDGLRKRHGEDA
ncbi:MAG: UDP-N-acetylmuramoyl-tripeptide--D-alanyl-D-alanine ligase [Gemmatimonadota bacterium]|nr:UDP-N-acetylmuramoyl-tripeptide--D-alanyl-D-alanine ligase [Gemmatimonadota bacterium]